MNNKTVTNIQKHFIGEKILQQMVLKQPTSHVKSKQKKTESHFNPSSIYLPKLTQNRP